MRARCCRPISGARRRRLAFWTNTSENTIRLCSSPRSAIPVIGLLGTVNWYARPVLPADFWSPKATVGFLDEHVGEHDQIVFVSAEQAGYYEAIDRKSTR